MIRPNPSVSSSENSDSESSESEIYVIPQRRAKPGNGYLNPNATSLMSISEIKVVSMAQTAVIFRIPVLFQNQVTIIIALL